VIFVSYELVLEEKQGGCLGCADHTGELLGNRSTDEQRGIYYTPPSKPQGVCVCVCVCVCKCKGEGGVSQGWVEGGCVCVCV